MEFYWRISLCLCFMLATVYAKYSPITDEKSHGGKSVSRIQTSRDNTGYVTEDELKPVLTTLNKVISDVAKLNATMEQIDKALDARISTLEKEKSVSFSVFKTGNLFWVDSDQTIPFAGITTNQGGHYDSNKSEFTCPYNGLYLFTFTMECAKSGDADVCTGSLIIGTTAVAYGDCGMDNNILDCSFGSTTVVQCDQGAKVFVRAVLKQELYGNKDYKATTFSGYLLSLV